MDPRSDAADRSLRVAQAALVAGCALALGSVVSAGPAPGTLTLDSVFPPGQSVCAGIPPRHADPLAAPGDAPAHSEQDFATEEITAGSVGEPPETDFHVLRWRHLSARPLSEEIPLDIVDGTVGVVIRAEAPTDDWNISVELLGPGGTLLACEECADAPVVGEIREGRGNTAMPSTDRPGWELLPGEYSFRVRATAADTTNIQGDGADVNVTATLRTNVAVDVRHRLDLNFIYLPNCTLTAEIARTSPRFAEYLAKVDQWMRPTGIRIGRVTHTDLHRDDFDMIATWEEAGRMFRTSSWVGKPRALNIYCVEGFEPPLNPVVGLSGGIPGPLANGTRDSGVAIRMQPFFICSNCLDAFASLTAHEIGHYLGFYHTTEGDLAHWDPFLDTPDCHEPGINECPDRNYVMFPLIHTANTIWSPHQALVAPTHPLVRTVAVATRHDAPEPPDRPLVATPNPFENEVRLALPAAGPSGFAVTIHDVTGRVVKSLGTATTQIVWDGTDAAGKTASAGIYFVRAVAPDGRATSARLVKVR